VSARALLYKEDWGKVREIFTAWWESEIKRPLLQVVAPKGAFHTAYDGWDFCRYPDQPELVVQNFERWCSQTYFGGLAYPNLWINFGPGVLSAFLGSDPLFTGQTMWFGNQREKGPLSLKELSDIDLDFSNVWWRRVESATRVAVSLHRDRFVVGMTDIGGVLDVIAALCGTVEMLKNMLRNPDGLKSAIWNITELWHECYDRLYRIMVEGGHDGTSAWMGLWSPRRWYPLQCDISYMISPQRFEEFVAPHLHEQCERLDHPVYHWDGPGQIPHLTHLLKLGFVAIQWVPGAHEELSGHDCGSPKWYELYRKVLETGKGLVLAMPSWRVEGFLKAFPKANVIVQTWVSSVEEAEKMLKALHWDEFFLNAVAAD